MEKKKTYDEISVFIDTLKANLKIFNLCKENLNTDEQKKVAYSISIELKKFCNTCIESYKP